MPFMPKSVSLLSWAHVAGRAPRRKRQPGFSKPTICTDSGWRANSRPVVGSLFLGRIRGRSRGGERSRSVRGTESLQTLSAGAEWIRTSSPAADRQPRLRPSRADPPSARRTHPSSCRRRIKPIDLSGGGPRSATHRPNQVASPWATLSAQRAHRFGWIDVSHLPFSSGERPCPSNAIRP